MSVLLAIATAACISWIIAQEKIFEGLRAWSERKAPTALYPLSCPYCLCPWVTAIVLIAYDLPWIWFFPIVWAAYHSLSAYDRLRG